MPGHYPYRVEAGSPAPLGATLIDGGVNFSLFTANATAVHLLLFDRYDQPEPSQTIVLDPQHNKTYYYWHCFVPDLPDGQLYGYRVFGPYQEERGLRFNPAKVLLDPYTRAVAYGDNWSRAEAYGLTDNTRSALKSVVIDTSPYDWEGDRPLQRPMQETVIYELHLKGFTAHPSSGVSCRGTYRGVIDKIPYLRDLGITAVEFLPLQQFDEQETDRINPLTGERLKNYWGYAPVAYFAPHLGYACDQDPRAALDEFRDMVKAFHRAGIEVLVDVVFNHTAEGDHTGPTISFRGLENVAYYLLKEDRRYYQDFTGTGNTVACNHSVMRRLIRQCLHYGVRELHLDGFRFDLASVMSRDEYGNIPKSPPLLWELDSDPILAGSKLIAEAWDAAGLYQLGGFTGDRWAEWNGRFRDDVRRFVRMDNGTVRQLAWRLTGSLDVFKDKASYVTHRSINYITCHDGFTLADLVSYNVKHNLANGENDRDGVDENYSWNCGVEGPTDKPEVLALRRRQIKNLMTLLLVARGTPMLLGGDEFGRTQQGNNNAYCQDNEISWLDWRLLETYGDLHRLVRGLIALRLAHPTLHADVRLNGLPLEEGLTAGVSFHGVELNQPDWSHQSHSLAMRLHGAQGDVDFYLIANAYRAALQFALPDDVRWRRIVDTSLSSPDDFCTEEQAPLVKPSGYVVPAHTVVLLRADSA
ncbi:MAG: glycogen debranching protein GlgX [Anaerolineales bacterium]